jgi:predicted DNA-binding ArsR family transcriptional regulator
VRSAPKDTLVIADGFSCRTQIAQATGRRALHLADVLEMAAHDGVHGPAGDYPERAYVADYSGVTGAHKGALALGAALGAGAALYAIAARRNGGGR